MYVIRHVNGTNNHYQAVQIFDFAILGMSRRDGVAGMFGVSSGLRGIHLAGWLIPTTVPNRSKNASG